MIKTIQNILTNKYTIFNCFAEMPTAVVLLIRNAANKFFVQLTGEN